MGKPVTLEITDSPPENTRSSQPLNNLLGGGGGIMKTLL